MLLSCQGWLHEVNQWVTVLRRLTAHVTCAGVSLLPLTIVIVLRSDTCGIYICCLYPPPLEPRLLGSCVHFSCKNNNGCVRRLNSGNPEPPVVSVDVCVFQVVRHSGHLTIFVLYRSVNEVKNGLNMSLSFAFLLCFGDIMLMAWSGLAKCSYQVNQGMLPLGPPPISYRVVFITVCSVGCLEVGEGGLNIVIFCIVL